MMALRRAALLGLTLLAGSLPAIAADDPPVSALPSQPAMPDPLVARDGHTVKTAEEWNTSRREELKALFTHYMYGKAPEPHQVVFSVERVDRQALGGKATIKEMVLAMGLQQAVKIHVLLAIPNKRVGAVPVFVGPNFYGNHAALKDPAIRLSTAWMPDRAPGVKNNRATDESRGTQEATWAIEDSIDRGYAVATFYCGDVAPDHPGLNDGVFTAYPKPDKNGWGAVRAWAWGVSRVVDYLLTEPDLDKSKIAVVGHSRLGKAAIVAGAFDERIALVIPLQAGCGGTAPSRGKIGESVQQINDRFPHWFCDEFKTFNTQTDRLPFDQNGLMALIAPRPILLSNAVDDQWANPSGQFEALKAAEGVYRLLGTDGLKADKMPEVGVLVDSTQGYFIRPGKHSMGREDWQAFWKFADKHFGRNGAK